MCGATGTCCRGNANMRGPASLQVFGIAAALGAALLVSSAGRPGCTRSAEATRTSTEEEVQKGGNPSNGQGESARKKSPLFAPEVEIQSEDYAEARKHFQTKLLRKGPSPQEWSPVKLPAGVTEIEYPSGKLRLKAWMNRPADETRKHPAVLFLHGGYAFDLDDWKVSKPYRDAGFVVLTPMLRAENGQPGAFTFFYDEVDDALAAASYLSEQPYVDADRMYVAGPSAGGTLALLAAMTSKRFRAAASFSASPDQVLRFKHIKNAARNVPVDLSNPRELQMRSPLAYATSFKCPARIYYGTQEPHFHLTSQRTAALAKERGLDVEAIQVKGNHSTSVPPAIKQSIAFFQKK
jgi:dienelactone hydrolase